MGHEHKKSSRAGSFLCSSLALVGAVARTGVFQPFFLFARLLIATLRAHGLEDALFVQRLLEATQRAVYAFAAAYFYFTCFLCHI